MQIQSVYIPIKYAHYPLLNFLDAFLLYLTEHPNIPAKPKRRVLQAYETYLEYARAYNLYWQSIAYSPVNTTGSNNTNNPLLLAVNKYVDIYYQAPPIFSFNYQPPQFDTTDYAHWRNPFILSKYDLNRVPRFKLAELYLPNSSTYLSFEVVLMRATINAELFITAESYQQSLDYIQWLTQVFGYPQRYVVINDLCILLPIILPKEVNDYLLEFANAADLDSLLRSLMFTGYKVQKDDYSLSLGERELLYISYPLTTAMIRMDSPSANNQLLPGQDLPSYGISAPFEFRISYPVGVVVNTNVKIERLLFSLGLKDEPVLIAEERDKLDELENETIYKSSEAYRELKVMNNNSLQIKPLQKIDNKQDNLFISELDYIPLKLQPIKLGSRNVSFIAEIPDKVIRTYSGRIIQLDTELFVSDTSILQTLNNSLDVRLITFDNTKKTVSERKLKNAEIVLIDMLEAKQTENAQAHYKVFVKFKMPKIAKKTKTKEYRILIKLASS